MDISGEYMVTNVREMATGFLLEPDHRFRFFLSYGALDRFASGVWRQEGNQLVFNSGKWSGADFTITQSEKGNEKEGIHVQLDPPNPMLAAYLHLSINGGQQDSWIPFRGQGEIGLEPQAIQSLSIQFEFCPERFTILPVKDGHTIFHIRPEQSLFELFLKDFTLQLSADGLSGGHPMMEGDFEYTRSR